MTETKAYDVRVSRPTVKRRPMESEAMLREEHKRIVQGLPTTFGLLGWNQDAEHECLACSGKGDKPTGRWRVYVDGGKVAVFATRGEAEDHAEKLKAERRDMGLRDWDFVRVGTDYEVCGRCGGLGSV